MLYKIIQDFSDFSSRVPGRLRKIVKSGIFAISCPSVPKERVECYRRNCHVFGIWRFFENISRRIKFN